MKRTILLGTLMAALLAPFAVAHAQSNVIISVNTPEFGIRIGGPVFHPVPVYAPVPVFVPAPVFAPAPVFVPMRVHAPRVIHTVPVIRGTSAPCSATLRSARGRMGRSARVQASRPGRLARRATRAAPRP